jgi:PAS domain S-box-containing protein
MGENKEHINQIEILKGEVNKLLAENAVLHAQLNEIQIPDRFRLLSDLTFEGIFIHKNAICVEVNQSYCNMTGYSREELIGKNLVQMLVLEESWPILLQNMQIQYAKPYRIKVRKRDGFEAIVEVESKSFVYQGEDLRVTAVRDITDRIKAEQLIFESEEKYKAAFKISPDSININKLNGVYVDINEGFTSLTGYTREDVIGVSSSEINIWALPEDREKLIEGLTKQGVVENLETLFKLKDGTVKTGLMSARLVNINNEPHILSVTKDISFRKEIENELILAKERAEESERKLIRQNEEYETVNEELQETNTELMKAKDHAEESDRLKTAFLCNMSHEIRTPMNAIIGFADFLLNPEVSEEKQKLFLGIIKNRTYDLLRIIEDILDISKIEVGQMNLVESEGDIVVMLNELLHYYTLKFENSQIKKHVSIKCNIDKSLASFKISTDHQRVKQILINLIDNAFKFTEKGVIEFGCKIANNQSLLFYVKDTGIGIPDNKHQIIFDRFRQAEESHLSRKQGGTGLGLSISKGLIDLLGGEIWLESVEGKGSVFNFKIPLKTNSEIPVEHKLVIEGLDAMHGGKTVLVVEDDYANALFLQEILSGLGFKLLNAYTGNEALDLLQKHSEVALILMDIRLPDINGLELTRRIKKSNPNIVIIAQTAYATPDDIIDCIKAGCSDYVSKPISNNKMLEITTKYLNK